MWTLSCYKSYQMFAFFYQHLFQNRKAQLPQHWQNSLRNSLHSISGRWYSILMPSKFCYCVVNDAYENSWHLCCIIIWYHVLHGLLVLVFYVMLVCCAVQFTMVMKTTDLIDVALTVLTILHQQCTKVYFW